MNRALEDLCTRWRSAERVVVLTGAGLSTASGIPDFRSPGGRWSRYKPIPIQDFLASEDARLEYWRYKGETWQILRDAAPNPAHDAIAELGRAGRVNLLVTQNVDGLHERSGFPRERLINIHGTDSTVTCMSCGRRESREHAQEQLQAGHEVPLCQCGGAWKPSTISFGQSLVEGDLRASFAAAGSCDLFLAAGTSLVVGPINEMFSLAERAGAYTAILTGSQTPFDARADCVVGNPLEQVLPAVAAAILQ